MSAGVRSRIWSVLEDWYCNLGKGSILMTWADTGSHGGLGLATLGEVPKNIVAQDAMLLVRRPLPVVNEPVAKPI